MRNRYYLSNFSFLGIWFMFFLFPKQTHAQVCLGGSLGTPGVYDCMGGLVCGAPKFCCDNDGNPAGNWYCTGSITAPNPYCATHTTQLSCEADNASSVPNADPLKCIGCHWSTETGGGSGKVTDAPKNASLA